LYLLHRWSDFDAMNANWPKTVAEAVDRLLDKELTEENIEKIRHMKKAELIDLHFGLGMWVRNNFGLLQGNNGLLEDCAKYAQAHAGSDPELRSLTGRGDQMHEDDASGVIIKALWERLQTKAP
jgi:hypothetical protein